MDFEHNFHKDRVKWNTVPIVLSNIHQGLRVGRWMKKLEMPLGKRKKKKQNKKLNPRASHQVQVQVQSQTLFRCLHPSIPLALLLLFQRRRKSPYMTQKKERKLM